MGIIIRPTVCYLEETILPLFSDSVIEAPRGFFFLLTLNHLVFSSPIFLCVAFLTEEC